MAETTAAARPAPPVAAGPSARGWQRWRRLLLPGLAVCWGHALLIQALLPELPARTGTRLPPATERRLVTLVATAPASPPPALAVPAAPATRPAPAAAAAKSATRPATKPALPGPATEPAVAAAPPTAPPAGAPAAEAAPAEAPDGAESTPPPRYATQLPAPVQLRYALRYNGRAGEALLVWRHDGQRYTLTLDGGPQGALPAQSSQGALDADGLAPERFVDRRPRGRQQAANFRRDIGRIGFSGPAVDFPAWPGAQDRLSWLAQLAAILGAGHGEPALQLFVVDARGGASLWQLQRQADEQLDTPWGEATLQRWQREPPRPEGLRVQAWLDPDRGHWPVLLRFTALRSGDLFELRLLAEPEPLPAGWPPP